MNFGGLFFSVVDLETSGCWFLSLSGRKELKGVKTRSALQFLLYFRSDLMFMMTPRCLFDSKGGTGVNLSAILAKQPHYPETLTAVLLPLMGMKWPPDSEARGFCWTKSSYTAGWCSTSLETENEVENSRYLLCVEIWRWEATAF